MKILDSARPINDTAPQQTGKRYKLPKWLLMEMKSLTKLIKKVITTHMFCVVII